MKTQIIDFLAKLPDIWLITITLISIFMVDVFYTLYFKYIAEDREYAAGFTSALLYVFSITGISSILEINNYLILPALVAAFLGTVVTVKIKRKFKNNV